jgi:hypothetical protein
MSALDSDIDGLYAQPLDQFTAARNALAKSRSGDDRARVKALEKPTVVAWAVNQVYWHARPAYERAMKAGAALRRAQIDALKGRKGDVREATAAHRDAVAAAVKEAERLAAAAGAHPAADALTRTFEALSLAAEPPSPGRLTEARQPSGFEALAGIQPVGHAAKQGPEKHNGRKPPEDRDGDVTRRGRADTRHDARAAAAAAKAERLDAQRQAEEARRREHAIRQAEAAVARAQAAERLAHDAWLRSQRDLDDARQRLARARVE